MRTEHAAFTLPLASTGSTNVTSDTLMHSMFLLSIYRAIVRVNWVEGRALPSLEAL